MAGSSSYRGLSRVTLLGVVLLFVWPAFARAATSVLTQTELRVEYMQLPSVSDTSGQAVANQTGRLYNHEAPGYIGAATMGGGATGTSVGASTLITAAMRVDVWNETQSTQWTKFSLYADTFVIDSDALSIEGLGGTGVGSLEYVFLFDGTFGTTFNPGPGAYILDEIRADVSLSVLQSGAESIVLEHALAPEWIGPNPPVHETLEIGDVVVASPRMGFQESALIPVVTQLRTSVEFAATGIDGGDFALLAESHFGSTAELLGVRVYDDLGALRTDVTVTSENGRDVVVLPEPSTALLVGFGLVALGMRERRAAGAAKPRP